MSSPPEDDLANAPSEGEDDLFGDDSDPEKLLDDLEDDDRRDGDQDNDEPPPTISVASIEFYRHRTPKPTDGTLKSLKVPPFLTWNPKEYKSATYEPMPSEIEESKEEEPRPVARFRKDPATGELQSNTTIYRWSDGSTTLAVGDQHYDVQTKSMAPPSSKPYSEMQDSHYYAAAAHLQSNSLVVVGHISEQYSVRPNRREEDAALTILKKRMAESKARANDESMFIRTTQDPELQKKQAELAEKERERARRRRENAEARMEGNITRGSRGGLSIGDLESGRKGGSRKRGTPGGARQKRRRPEYDSDDDLPQGKGRQEDYDMEDDFIAPSDEEISEGQEDDDDILDDEEEERPRSKRKKTAEDEDADDDVRAPARGHGRRRVVDDDDD